MPSGVQENGTTPGPLVIGESREDAAALFGPSWDHFAVTTYAELADELSLATAVGLAAGAGFVPALDVALGRLGHEAGFLVEVEIAGETADAVRDRLAAAGLHLAAVRTSHDRVVARLGSTSDAPEAPPATEGTRTAAAEPVPAVPASPQRRGRGARRGGGRRTRLAFAAVMLVVLGVVLAVAALARGLDGAIAVLVSATLLGEAVLAVLVRRAVLATDRAADLMSSSLRPSLVRNRRVLDKRTERILGRLRELQGDTAHSRTELVALRRYVEILAEEQARLRARLDRSGIADLAASQDPAHRTGLTSEQGDREGQLAERRTVEHERPDDQHAILDDR